MKGTTNVFCEKGGRKFSAAHLLGIHVFRSYERFLEVVLQDSARKIPRSNVHYVVIVGHYTAQIFRGVQVHKGVL